MKEVGLDSLPRTGGLGPKPFLSHPRTKQLVKQRIAPKPVAGLNKVEIRDCNGDDLCSTLKVAEVYTNSIAVVLFFHTSMYIVGSGLIVSFLSKLDECLTL